MLNGRVDIDFLIGMLVVVSMGGGPPERAALHGAVAKDGEEELTEAGGLEGAVGKVAVVEAGDGKHADEVEEDRGNDDGGIDADPEDGKAAEVEEDEGEGALPVDLVGEVGGIGGFLAPVVRVEPLTNHPEGRGDDALPGFLGRGH